jgi:hypothetical protein
MFLKMINTQSQLTESLECKYSIHAMLVSHQNQMMLGRNATPTEPSDPLPMPFQSAVRMPPNNLFKKLQNHSCEPSTKQKVCS